MADRSGPFDGIEELLDRLNRQIETAARSWETQLDNRSRLDLSMGESATSMDLADEGDAFAVTVDVPGFESDDLELRLTGRTLAVSGERERSHSAGDEDYIRRERETQSFSRQVRLPEPVDDDAVRAGVNNGVLTIMLPKREPGEETRSIDIE